MRKSVGTFAVIPLCALIAAPAVAQDDFFSIGGSVRQLWDSNYSRTPDEEEDSESITLTSAFVTLDKTLSRQRFIARWQVSQYHHADREDLDATLNEGRATWQGQWGSRLRSKLEWVRDSYPVDRLEFADKDIVRRDDVNALVTYGAGHRLTLGLGGRQTAQTHSNGLREGLDFDEDEGFAEIGYKTGIQSTLALRVRYGERTYPNEELLIPFQDLNFEYQQVEFEGTWETSAKTSLSTTLAYFNRDGVINDGSGALATLEAEWEMSEKVTFNGGYSYRQPAVGETSDSPEDTHMLYVDAKWQWTPKVNLGVGASVVEHIYDNASPGPERDETLYRVSPLRIAYEFSEQFSLRLDTAWVDRQSPLVYRDYSSAQATFGVSFRY
jgi:hypothetical protein